MQENFMYFRPYTHNDFDMLRSWIDTERVHLYWCAGMFSDPLEQDEFEQFLNDGNHREAKIAVDDNEEPFGFCVFQKINEARILMRLVVVNNQKRGSGYGSKLQQLAADYAFKDHDAESLELDVFSENERAIRSYEKNGYIIQEAVNADIVINGTDWPRFHMIKHRGIS